MTPSEIYDDMFINDPLIRELFDNKWRSVPIVAGKSVNLDSYSHRDYNLKNLADETGYTNFLQLPDGF